MNLDFETPVTEIETQLLELKAVADPDAATRATIAELEKQREAKLKALYASLTPWQTVQVARHPERPMLRDFIAGLTVEFVELHGDRLFGDDQGIIGGLATLKNQQRVMILGHQKGKNIEENLRCNFGMARPEGYRKALRLMKLAEKYGLPVLSFIDTPGAFPGADAEERGQAEAIARNMMEMAVLKTPVVVLITGEGGSGGAIGIGVGDVILMLQYAVYSVISPEGCASILWRDGSKAPEAANALKITAPSLKQLKIIDGIIPEPLGGAHRDYPAIMQTVGNLLGKTLKSLVGVSAGKLVSRRYNKFAAMGRAS
ncbi:MAG: acetyl-CoA carboxylase carboxyltransferase subunit alpha [bacterium]